jgi:hypothetical protein
MLLVHTRRKALAFVAAAGPLGRSAGDALDACVEVATMLLCPVAELLVGHSAHQLGAVNALLRGDSLATHCSGSVRDS